MSKPGVLRRHFDPSWALRQLPGDLLIIPAGVLHRFEDLSDGLATSVICYGPEGGE